MATMQNSVSFTRCACLAQSSFAWVLPISIVEPLLDKLCASLNIMLLSKIPGMCEAIRRDGAGDGHLVSNAHPTVRSDFCSLLHSQVSKNDNLAGIAVKYGISVSDIKKANGLLSDNGCLRRTHC